MREKPFGKTEQLLLKAISLRGAVTIEWVYGRGPEGGFIRHNSRRWDAAWSLVKRGRCKVRRHERFIKDGVTHNIVIIEEKSDATD